ncbi:MAG: N5-glutamine methyltransferase family protein [Acidimicrobiales bacterium]
MGSRHRRTAAAPSPRRPPAARLVERLAAAGCVAADEEAAELVGAAGGDPARLERLVGRRLAGEPLAWVTGGTTFAGHRVRVDPGVYVPRCQTEGLVARAIAHLPGDGVAVDLCTGSGAVALALSRARPSARVLGTDVDPAACRCAAANGVEVHPGHLAEPVPPGLVVRVDVVVAVVPYVPTAAIELLPSDARDHEPRRALDGGPDGLGVLRPAVAAAASLLRPGGVALLELGGDQDVALRPTLAAAGLDVVARLVDEDGDLRGVECRRAAGVSHRVR